MKLGIDLALSRGLLPLEVFEAVTASEAEAVQLGAGINAARSDAAFMEKKGL